MGEMEETERLLALRLAGLGVIAVKVSDFGHVDAIRLTVGESDHLEPGEYILGVAFDEDGLPSGPTTGAYPPAALRYRRLDAYPALANLVIAGYRDLIASGTRRHLRAVPEEET